MQQDLLTVTDEAQAKALQDVGFLGRFLEPTSPSKVAQDLGLPANLAHHHVRRLTELGLLFEAGRDGRKVLYQLSARTFRYSRDLLQGEGGDSAEHNLRRLSEHFWHAYERSGLLASGQDPEYAEFHFYGGAKRPAPKPLSATANEQDAYPAHLHSRTVRLSPEQYRRLAVAVSALIREAVRENQPNARPCTFAWLTYQGVVAEGADQSEWLHTFLDAPPRQ